MSCGASSGAAEHRPRPPDFLAVAGPTCAGKTALSVLLARELGGEIVSMDSRQIYRGMDVGTAKAPVAERGGAPHFGLDIRDPRERYGAGQFGRDARRWIAAIRARGRVAVLVGGTGFYLKALVEPLFEEPPLDADRRAALEAELERRPPAELERWTAALDPSRAQAAARGGRRRMLRALSVALLTGRPLSWWHRRRPAREAPLRGVVGVIEVPPEVLSGRIERRVAAMAAGGLADEVAGLLRSGCAPDAPGMTGVGYREMAAHLQGGPPLDETCRLIAAATRRYARRQRTWFRRQLGAETVHAVAVDGTAPAAAQCAVLAAAWRTRAEAAP